MSILWLIMLAALAVAGVAALVLVGMLFGQYRQARKKPRLLEVSGTDWIGKDSDGDDYLFHFLPDGSLHYQAPSGFWKNGTWKQEGASVYFEMNQKQCQHQGVINGESMEGEAWNAAGHRWTWHARLRKTAASH